MWATNGASYASERINQSVYDTPETAVQITLGELETRTRGLSPEGTDTLNHLKRLEDKRQIYAEQVLTQGRGYFPPKSGRDAQPCTELDFQIALGKQELKRLNQNYAHCLEDSSRDSPLLDRLEQFRTAMQTRAEREDLPFYRYVKDIYSPNSFIKPSAAETFGLKQHDKPVTLDELDTPEKLYREFLNWDREEERVKAAAREARAENKLKLSKYDKIPKEYFIISNLDTPLIPRRKSEEYTFWKNDKIFDAINIISKKTPRDSLQSQTGIFTPRPETEGIQKRETEIYKEIYNL